MDNEFIMVSINHLDQSIETRQCRYAPLPDGTLGVLWRGLVWPLRDGGRIEAAGPAFPLLRNDPADSPRFGLVDGEEEAWLIFEGSGVLRDATATALRQAALEVLRSGPWLGDPVDGVVGTNFIRFVRPAVDDLRSTIAEILEDRLNSAPAKPNAVEQVRLLRVELIEARAALARKEAVKQRQIEPSAEVAGEIALLQSQNALLMQEITDLNRQLAEAVVVRPEPSRAVGGCRTKSTFC